jgi:hypothetical protein
VTHPALKRLGLTESQAKTLARLFAGQNVSGGMAGVALLRKGLVEETEHVPGGIHGYMLTDAGRAALEQARRLGW